MLLMERGENTLRASCLQSRRSFPLSFPAGGGGPPFISHGRISRARWSIGSSAAARILTPVFRRRYIYFPLFIRAKYGNRRRDFVPRRLSFAPRYRYFINCASFHVRHIRCLPRRYFWFLVIFYHSKTVFSDSSFLRSSGLIAPIAIIRIRQGTVTGSNGLNSKYFHKLTKP